MAIPTAVRGLLKAVVSVALFAIVTVVYVITYVVPYFGGGSQRWRQKLESSFTVTNFKVHAWKMRGLMVRIVAEEDNRDLEFKSSEQYHERLIEIREDARNRLEAGEAILSIVLGSVLLGLKLAGFQLLQLSVYGVSAALLLEAWVLAIAVSIIYRSKVLDALAYSGDENFTSLEEMDAALGYQKGVSLVAFVQGLMFVVVFMAAITRVKYSWIETGLRAKYTGNPWMAPVWQELRS